MFMTSQSVAQHGRQTERYVLIFAPELLARTCYYARLFPVHSGHLTEETDRYAQALIYKDLAHTCFAEAKRRFRSY